MLLDVDHGKVAITAQALDEHAAGLRKSVASMKEALEPLYKNWYQSGSPTGDKVHKHEVLIDQAMGEITKQMSGSGTVLADFSKDLRTADDTMGA